MSTEKPENTAEMEKEVRLLQIDMIGVKHILTTQGDTLREIKDVLVILTRTLDEVTRAKERIQVLDEDIVRDRKKFEDHESYSNAKIIENEKFKGKIAGALIVASIFFGFVQTSVGWYVIKNDTYVEQMKEKISTMDNRMHRLEEKVGRPQNIQK